MKRVHILLVLFIFSIIYSISGYSQNNFWSEIIDLKSNYKLNNNKLILQKTCTIQINERMGDNDAKVKLYYSKGEKINIKDAQIIDIAGNIVRKLKKNEISDESAVHNSALYSDLFVKSFELKHNVYPYQIIYTYEYETTRFINILSLDYSLQNTPIRNHEITVQVPNNQKIIYQQKNIKEPEQTLIENSNIFKWKINHSHKNKKEKHINYNKIDAPKLEVYPLNFKYGKSGSFESWISFGNWIYELNQGRDALPESEKIKINKLLEEINDDKEKVRALYYYMQDYTRYVNVSINIGGLQTYPAEYVCTNRYGDCKALTNYMQSMLKYIGIKSYYTLINLDDYVKDIDTNFPHQAFNHVILTVPIKNDTIYLECTSKNTAFGYVHTAIQNRKALLIDEDNSHLINIPPMKLDNVLCTRNIHINTITNLSEVRLTATNRGDLYELFNTIKNDINKSVADRYIRNNILYGSYDIIDYKIEENNRNNNFIKLNVDCRVINISKNYGNNIIIKPFSLDIPSFDTPENRTFEVQIDYPEYKKDSIVYEFSDKSISKIPDDIQISTPYGYYSVKYGKDSNKLIVEKTLKILAGRYSLDDYKSFYEFIYTITNHENKNIYIETL